MSFDTTNWLWLKHIKGNDGWTCSNPYEMCAETLKVGEVYLFRVDPKYPATPDEPSIWWVGPVMCNVCYGKLDDVPAAPVVHVLPDLPTGVFALKHKYYQYAKWSMDYPSVFFCYGCPNSSQVLSDNSVWALWFCTGSGEGGGEIYCPVCALRLFNLNPGESPIDMPKTKTSSVCLGCKEPNCSVCAVCHTENCAYTGYKVTTAAHENKYAHLRAKTQKARGYAVLAEAKMQVPNPYSIILSDTTKEDLGVILEEYKKHHTKAFVRPCPTRPRHGFVDSRAMDLNTDEVFALLEHAKTQDEENTAELLIVPFVESEYNAIVTPNRIAVGPGNDGATAGHGSMSFPLAGVPFKGMDAEVLSRARINSISEDPYIEAVLAKSGLVFFTQIRAGVKIPPIVGADFVPRRMRVLQVIEASGDLLEWEAQTRSIKAGTVVCHLGGTLISHYGVHCMQNDIAVFTSRRPEVGEVLEPVDRPAKPNPEDVIRGLAAGAMMPLENSSKVRPNALNIHEALIMMMTTLHNSAAMSGADGFWIGAAVSIMFRAGMAASHGEARHKISSGVDRSTVYKMALKDFFDARATLGQAQYKFQHALWSSGYGGKAWAKCTEAIIQMDGAVRELMNTPSDENVAALITRLNDAVNQAHNGGWWLNKFITQEWFTKASNQQLDAVVRYAVSAYKMKHLTRDGDYSAALQQWKNAEAIQVQAGYILADVNHRDTPFEDEGKKSNSLKGYVGVACMKCGYQFTGLDKDDTLDGMTCGHSNDEDDDDYCTGEVAYCHADGSWTVPKQPPEPLTPPITPLTNVDQVVQRSVTDEVVAVQGNIHQKALHKGMLHVQFKTVASLPGYYSFNVGLDHWDASQYGEIAKHMSWSGSHVNNYMELDIVGQDEGVWELALPALKIHVKFNIISLDAFEVHNEPTQETPQESAFDDSPF